MIGDYLMASSERLSTAMREYESALGPIPFGIHKWGRQMGKTLLLAQDLEAAVARGKPITDWRVYVSSWPPDQCDRLGRPISSRG